ncbi:hypothetical protein F4678DRAFT_414695, partial [Xylaria arbuscula]
MASVDRSFYTHCLILRSLLYSLFLLFGVEELWRALYYVAQGATKQLARTLGAISNNSSALILYHVPDLSCFFLFISLFLRKENN